ncbi:MAG: CoB--CoM heterodisulfide reductase iron-sulfur subunit A family protein [Candidatus Bathyarchaeota archaeon]|nr:MAG: CoB--CoM heterodisulfide reductase iron-sulfur subunit A family protein [Candidatus Bathyarchaeota archaeon]
MLESDKEMLRVGVFVCHCGVNIGGVVDVPEVVEYSKTLPGVVYAERNLYTCSSDGLNGIKEAVQKYDLNRVVVASCTPRTHESLFKTTCEEAGLNKYLFEMTNIRDQCSWVHMHEPEKATEKAKDLVKMAVAKSLLNESQEELETEVKPAALVIGGGIAGMTAALSLANQGFQTHLVERESELGGMLRGLYKLYPTDADARALISQIVDDIKSNDMISVSTSTVVEDIKGYIGSYEVTVRGSDGLEELKFGTIIVATGAEELKPNDLYGYGKNERVITQLQLEEVLRENRLEKPEKVVMIQCVGAREEKGRSYCSRICCMTAIKNAAVIRDLSPETDVYILYRDLQTYGKDYEEYHRKTREKGVKFIRYSPETPPEVLPGPNGKVAVKVFHTVLGEELSIPSDLVVLSTPLVQHQDGRNLSPMLKVPLDSDGFFLEAHVKLRPVDFATDGIYLCGTAHGPKSIDETVAQAYAAASRASIPMSRGKVRAEAITSVVDEESCIGCGLCEEVCPFSAIRVEMTDKGRIARTITASCKGCGVCGAGCPQRAISMCHFTDEQLLAQVVTLAESEVKLLTLDMLSVG